MSHGCFSVSLGRKSVRYKCVECTSISGEKCAAKANGNPSSAARRALKSLEPNKRDGNPAVPARDRLDHLAGLLRTEVRPQLRKQFGKIVARLVQVAAKRAHRVTVAARCAAQSQIDATRIQGFQGSELFRNHQRRVIRQHDPAAANANGLRC